MIPQVGDEVAIEWDLPRTELESPYIREGVVATRYPRRPLTLQAVDGERVAYAVLAADTDPARTLPGSQREYVRRVWWVAPADPYGPPGPCEAVVPESVAAGVESDPWLGGGEP